MRRILVSLATLAMTAGVAGFAGSSTAAADHGPCDVAGPGGDNGNFCAFRANNYQGKLPLDPGGEAPAGTDPVNVLDNATNSVINHTGNVWCGVDGAGANDTILVVEPGKHKPNIGSLYNKIDWFYVRSTSEGCDD